MSPQIKTKKCVCVCVCEAMLLKNSGVPNVKNKKLFESEV